MPFIIETPNTRASERDYILSVLMGEFFDIPWRRVPMDRTDVRITLAGQSGEIRMPDILFQTPKELWLTHGSLPAQPVQIWDTTATGIDCLLVKPKLPVIYGNSNFLACKNLFAFGLQSTICTLPLDIFGSAFFMLTRYEEIVGYEHDEHDRFPAEASLAYQEGFLDRPIINEYVEVLWAVMKELWPGLRRKSLKFRKLVSCDVDNPFESYTKSFRSAIRKMSGDILKRRSYTQSLQTLRNYLYTRMGNYSNDPLNTFDWIMDVNEKAGNRVAFYFQVDRTDSDHDVHYSIHALRIRSLMRRIHSRGHEIGLHSSYRTYLDESQCAEEVAILRDVMEEEGIRQSEIGNRQHYLRWRTPETALNLENAGITYDTTLAYADCPGFRCGTCLSFPMYDLITRKPLSLRQYPLILMECAVIDDCYLGMGYSDNALDLMLTLKKRTLQFGGIFTFLWHNSRLESDTARSMYRGLLA